MAESVDALVSNTSRETCAGSTPALGTKPKSKSSVNQAFAEDFSFLGSQRVAKNNTTPHF